MTASQTAPSQAKIGPAPYKRIASEEGWCPPEMLKIYRRIIENKELADEVVFDAMWRFYLDNPSERVTHINTSLGDLDAKRIGHMDASGIDMQILMLTAPGVQVMKADEAVGFAAYSNDYLAAAVKKYPTRFAGFAAVAPQRPTEAAKEIQRGVNQLGMKGVIINSHTLGEYLDDPKFWPIFEACEANNVPLYIHPTALPKTWGVPFMERGLDGAIYGFGVDVALHVLRIIVAGVFDRFPKLQIGIGHMGEAIPFWLYRIDYMHRQTVIAKRYDAMKPLKRKPSEYLRENMFITNSGVAWEPAIKFTQQVVGVDRVLYAQDYPYQYVQDEVRALDAMDMPADDKKAFFQTNAERIFKL